MRISLQIWETVVTAMQNCCYRIGGMMFSRCGNGKKRLRDASKLLEDRLEDSGFFLKSTSLYVAEMQ